MTGIIIGDIIIPIEKTFMKDRDGIHLPVSTFMEIVAKYGLELQVIISGRSCPDYPYRYSTLLNGVEIFIINKELIHFD